MSKPQQVVSGRERRVGNLYKYAVIALTGLIFAGLAIYFYVASAAAGNANLGRALLLALLCAAGVGILGIIIWYIYKAVAFRGKS
ncbi:MAG: hypothetical protein ACP5SI_09000 [Chloroflexia bacterium]